jgi:hypothetical protein
MIAVPIIAVVFFFVYMIVTTSLHYAERIKLHEENIKRLDKGYPPIEQAPMGIRGGRRELRLERKPDGSDKSFTEYDDDRYDRN